MNTPATATRLLATKLYLPVARATAVTRPRLVARLLDGFRTRLTLVAAPAGFGKSTVLAQALSDAERAVGGQLFASVALDPGDNDPARFWTYVLTALERSGPGLGAPSLALLHAAPTAVEAALAELLNRLAEQSSEIVLILDDYHVIANRAIHDSVSFLLEHAPPQFHLVIASRVDPPLPLARWRVRGMLAEVRASDLRFTSDEALRFLADTMGLRLDPQAAAALEARTEGWAAGLQLAALSLQGQEDVQGFIESFSGSHRHVVDYLAEEVLGRLPDHIRAFLLQTSVLERLSGPLCDAVLGVANDLASGDSYSRIVLDTLDRDNLFLIPLDTERRWYRYHHLFADLLRHRLQHEQPARVAELHRRAALWYEQRDAVFDTMTHALASADVELVTRLLTTYGPRVAATGETQTLQRWLDALPREVLLHNPRLCVVQSQVLLLDRRSAAVEPYLDAAERALAATDDVGAAAVRGELLVQRAHLAIERGMFAEALALARQALELLPAADSWARSSAGLVLGYALMVLGKTDEAVAVHVENVPCSRAAGHAVAALFSGTEVAKLRVLQGRLGEARAAAEEALVWAAAEGWKDLAPTSALHIWLGNVMLEQGDFAGADRELGKAIRLTQHGPAITAARAHTFLARLRQHQGDAEGAAEALSTVEAICRSWEPGGERSFFEAYVARIRLLAGDAAAVRRWAAERRRWEPGEPPSYFREIELLTLVRVLVISGPEVADDSQMVDVLELLRWLREGARIAGRAAVEIETLAVEALVRAGDGDVAQAHHLVREALARAAPEGFAGIFLDLGAPMAALLARSLAQSAPVGGLHFFLTRLLGLFPQRGDTPTPPAVPAAPVSQPTRASSWIGTEALTERELEVLRLYAAGMTSSEIAAHFVVSINTVKTQLKSIYSKLDAHSRAEAVAYARERRLIP